MDDLGLTNIFSEIGHFFKIIWIHLPIVGQILNIIFFVAAVFSLFIIVYSIVRLRDIRRREHEHLHHELQEYAHHHTEEEKLKAEKAANPQQLRWKGIIESLSSNNSNNWKIAIVDADSMLEDLLDQLGFAGENLGEKLKSVNFKKYPELNSAWEVHLVRNKIAHDGADFVISKEETEKIIATYERIFRSFRYI